MPAWVTPTTWTTSTAITPRKLQDISDDLQYLKDTADSMSTSLGTIAPSPVQRACTWAGSNVWNTGRAYTSGKVQAFLNGLLRVRGTDWTEVSPSSGQIQFTFTTVAGDIVDVLDWTP